VRRELLQLGLGVVLLDALFIGGYFLFHLDRASTTPRVWYTAAWTIATLAVVLRGLTRIRRLRRHSR
jgi:hypothetical protein